MSVAPQDNLGRVARSLLELGVTDVVFVGGATIGLYLTDPAAPQIYLRRGRGDARGLSACL